MKCLRCGHCCKSARVSLRIIRDGEDAVKNAPQSLLHDVGIWDGDHIYRIKLRYKGVLIGYESVIDTPDDAICGALDSDGLCMLHETGKPEICKLAGCPRTDEIKGE